MTGTPPAAPRQAAARTGRWPRRAASRPQWWEPPHASIAIRSAARVKRAMAGTFVVCVASVTASMCAFIQTKQAPTLGQVSARTLTQRGA